MVIFSRLVPLHNGTFLKYPIYGKHIGYLFSTLYSWSIPVYFVHTRCTWLVLCSWRVLCVLGQN